VKILFISSRNFLIRGNGGDIATYRNYFSFCEIAGENNVKVIYLSGNPNSTLGWKIKKRINYFRGFKEGLDGIKMKQIIQNSFSFDVVFIESSDYGTIAYHLKKAKYPGRIITFFHNIEFDIIRQLAKREPWRFPKVPLNYYNEKQACNYSDVKIVLNSRDSERLHRNYGPNEALIIPISIRDGLKNTDTGSFVSSTPTCLFLGSAWYPNVQGILWFVNNVLDHVDIKLQIVGIGTEILKEKINSPKVEIMGYVEDLSQIISNADLMVFPIFLGGGMKVKTCEALMYGKQIIGTTESFEGYNLNLSKVGAVCNTKEDFISAINKISAGGVKRFNSYNRDSFLKNYSFEATLKLFRVALEEKTKKTISAIS